MLTENHNRVCPGRSPAQLDIDNRPDRESYNFREILYGIAQLLTPA